MRGFDLSTWQALLSTIAILALITLLGVGVRLLIMYTIQQRRERENRRINERLRTLIAAYRVLGGSFTGELAVDPTHLRDLRRLAQSDLTADADGAVHLPPRGEGSDRARRMRDAVEAALSDVILLGTDDHVQLAAHAARELVEGRPVHTAELVHSLRSFIRDALGLEAIPPGIEIPMQGPTRPSGSGGRGRGQGGREGGGRGGGGGMGAAAGMGGGVGMGIGLGGARTDGDSTAS